MPLMPPSRWSWTRSLPSARRRRDCRMSLLIKGADLLGAGRQDLLISDGVIIEIGSLKVAGMRTVDQTIDANGLVALPGLVDLHTHLPDPGRADAETIASG